MDEQGEVQFTMLIRKSQRKQLAYLASEADMTMRAFVLNALKERGLEVRDTDLVDLRKERGSLRREALMATAAE